MAAPGIVLATEQESPRWVFEPLPKAFQKNPRLDLMVVTELTPEGRKLPEVDERHPAYYVAQSAGYRRAAAAPAGEKTLPDDALEAFVRRSLARRGYYPASGSAAPPLSAEKNSARNPRACWRNRAYDHAQLLRNRRVLLWRTRMTVSTEGVAQTDALPTLITAASSYFGREMDGPAVLSRRAVPRGEVEVGPPQVVEEDVPGRGELRPER